MTFLGKTGRAADPPAGRPGLAGQPHRLAASAGLCRADRGQGTVPLEGQGPGLDFSLCQAIRRILAAEEPSGRWSRRATERIGEIRHEFAWLDADTTAVLIGPSGEAEWWTFAGSKANATLARELSWQLQGRVTQDSLTLTFEPHVSLDDVRHTVDHLRLQEVERMRPAVEDDAMEGLKFSACVPPRLAVEMLEERLCDPEATRRILGQSVRFVSD